MIVLMWSRPTGADPGARAVHQAVLAGLTVVHIRLVVPPDLVEPVLGVLRETESVYGIVHLPGVAERPDGDLVTCEVAREDASIVVDDLCRLGLDEVGSIVLEDVDTAVSAIARRPSASLRAPPADAVVWEEVEARTSEGTELSGSFLAFMVVATLIAGVGILTDSIILIIGAMVVGPEFGPLAALCVSLVERRLDLARRSAIALAVGFPVAILATYAGTLIFRWIGKAPEETEHPETLFISDPNWFSVVVAVLAGIAGMLSLTTAKSGALVGVLISVTTIPAAANVGVAAAYADWREVAGAGSQLLINLASIVCAGVATLLVQRIAYSRRRERHRRNLASPTRTRQQTGDRTRKPEPVSWFTTGRAGSSASPSRGTAHPARHYTSTASRARSWPERPPAGRARRPHAETTSSCGHRLPGPEGGSSAREATPSPESTARPKEGARGGTMGFPHAVNRGSQRAAE